MSYAKGITLVCIAAVLVAWLAWETSPAASAPHTDTVPIAAASLGPAPASSLLAGAKFLSALALWSLPWLIVGGLVYAAVYLLPLWLRGKHAVEMVRAHRPVSEHLESYSPHWTYSPRWPAHAAPAPAPMLEVEHTPPEAPTFAQLLSTGQIGKDAPLLLGYSDGQPLTGSWKDLYSSAVAGISGSGKTTTVRFLAAQAALHGARFAILDPHADTGDESLAATLSALQPAMLCEPATVERDMLAVVRLMHSHLDTRLTGNTDRTPLLLCVDEFTKLMRSAVVADPLAQLLEAIAQEGRKVGIFCALSGQIWTGSRTNGTPLRDSLASCYVHRLRRNQARLLLSTEEARLAEALEPGRALLLRTNGDCDSVSIPQCTASDVERIGYQLATPTATALPPTPAPIMPTGSQHVAGVSPEARHAAELFLAGQSPAEIVLKLRGIKSNEGGRYQTALGEVLDLVRTGVKTTHHNV